jgi:hypothetical protein
MDAGERVWRYTVFVPTAQLLPTRRAKATPQDLERLDDVLVEQFGGLTTLPRVTGHGLRNPRGRPQQPGMNDHVPHVVYAAPLAESDAYFRALRTELQDARVRPVNHRVT